jgi:hypothetical protein
MSRIAVIPFFGMGELYCTSMFDVYLCCKRSNGRVIHPFSDDRRMYHIGYDNVVFVAIHFTVERGVVERRARVGFF